MGSTVILLFANGHTNWLDELQAEQSVRMGQALGSRN
jgi:phosphatidylserine decarboxylase